MLKTSVAVLTLTVLPLTALAQNPDPAKLASALGITEAQLMNCLPDNATPGQRLPRDQRAAVAQCFQKANPDLTPKSIRAAMQRMQAGN